MTRSLRPLAGWLLLVAASLAAAAAIIVIVALAAVWRQDGHLHKQERQTLRRSAVVVVAGLVGAGAGYRLARGRRPPGDETHAGSFDLVYSKDGRQERLMEAAGAAFFFLGLTAELWYCAPGGPLRRAGQVAGWLAVAYLGIHLRVLLHELGHLGAGRLVGLAPWTLRLGAGPVLARGQTHAGFQWQWRLRPGGGWAECRYRSEETFRRDRFWVVLGGPVADALLVAASWLVWASGGRPALLSPDSAGLVATDMLIVVTLLSMVAGLVPHRIFTGGRQLHSDGWWLLKAFSLPTDRIRGWMFMQEYARVQRWWEGGRQTDALAALEALRGRRPDRADFLLAIEGHMHREKGDPARAAACFRQALEGGAVTAARRRQLREECAAALAAAGDVDGARA